jgi:uncharacterized protein (TIGR02246 family)
MTASAAVFNQFIAAINAHDAQALAALMTQDHLFVDSLGNQMQGAKTMEDGWRGYFSLCPDYWIRIRTLASDGLSVLASGEAGGTINNIRWRTPAAWEAVVEDGAVAEWRVFADNKPVYEILARQSR